MIPIYHAPHIRAWDAFTIAHEPIASIDLMERAAHVISDVLGGILPPQATVICCCGPGNNGGDGLAVCRLLLQAGYSASAWLLQTTRLSDDTQTQLQWLQQAGGKATPVRTAAEIPAMHVSHFIIDALYGTGLNRPPEGLAAEWIRAINGSGAQVISIDMPSGLLADSLTSLPQNVVEATHTLTLQTPKWSLLMPETERYVGEWQVLDIGLHPDFGQQLHEPLAWILEATDMTPLAPPHGRHTYKGKRGHALLLAGSPPMMGAALLAAHACARSGAGLLTVATPQPCWPLVQQSLPMAIAQLPQEVTAEWLAQRSVKAIGMGPGSVAIPPLSAEACWFAPVPLVLDAGAIEEGLHWHKHWGPREASWVITPHIGEFDRAFGAQANHFERSAKARQVAADWNVIVVLKGAYTQVVLPTGQVYVNATGNAGMAKGGSGDVLCGLLTGLLAQGMPAHLATMAAVYLLGAAGDAATRQHTSFCTTPMDTIAALPEAMRSAGWR